MHNPKFTIITVTFNAGKSLEKTVQSVISQTYRNVCIVFSFLLEINMARL